MVRVTSAAEGKAHQGGFRPVWHETPPGSWLRGR